MEFLRIKYAMTWEKKLTVNLLGSVFSEGIPRNPRTLMMPYARAHGRIDFMEFVVVKLPIHSEIHDISMTIEQVRWRKVTIVSFLPRQKLVMIPVDSVRLHGFLMNYAYIISQIAYRKSQRTSLRRSFTRKTKFCCSPWCWANISLFKLSVYE